MTPREGSVRIATNSPFMTVVSAPFVRLAEMPGWAKAWTLVAALVNAVVGDMFLGLFALLFLTTWVDWIVGKRAARIRKEYSPELAHLGMHSKAAGLVLVLLIYALSLWARAHLAFAAENWISLGPVVLAFAFILQDLESIEEHRQNMGARPMPLLSRLLTLLRRIPDRVLNAAEPRDDEPVDQGTKP